MKNLRHVCLCIACALLVHCLSIACAVDRHSVTDTHTIEYRDTTHLEIVTDIIDTTHVKETTKERVRVEEYYDPRTGALQKRVTDMDRETEAIRDECKRLSQQIEELSAKLAAQKDNRTETEKEVKPNPVPWWVVCSAFAWGIIFVILVAAYVLLKYSAKLRIKK